MLNYFMSKKAKNFPQFSQINDFQCFVSLKNHSFKIKINMQVIGIIAAVLTTGAFLPQVIKTLKTKKTEDLSLITFLMILFGTILWFIYGYSLGDKPLMFANGITACLTAVILGIKVKNEYIS